MGSPKDEAFRLENEDQVVVKITRGFWMGKYEVTQDEWHRVMDTSPSLWQGKKLPVEMISWQDATSFCQKLNKIHRSTGNLPKSWVYRLATEAQWEYACRAGTGTAYASGDDLKGEYAWYFGTSNRKTHRVGEKKPNAWGLCDMHGNVMEWCRDGYEDKLPGGSDPEVTKETERLIRGGSWASHAKRCRSAYRNRIEPVNKHYSHFGFRVVLVQSGS